MARPQPRWFALGAMSALAYYFPIRANVLQWGRAGFWLLCAALVAAHSLLVWASLPILRRVYPIDFMPGGIAEAVLLQRILSRLERT